MSIKEFDVVLYGATGFVGRQAVEHFLRYAPPGLRWAIAGRNAARLEALGANVPILIADASDPPQVDAIAHRTRVLLTTAGPFKYHGDPFVDACVRHATDYVDISGETGRIMGLIQRHHEAARAAGVRVINFCGVSSALADLGVFRLNERLDGALIEATAYLQLKGGSFSGGSISSIADAYASGEVERERDVFLLNPGTTRPPAAIERDPHGLRFDRAVGAWTSASPMGISDTRAVRRSAALCGRDIVFQEYMMFPGAIGLVNALGFATVLSILHEIMRRPTTRKWLQRRIPSGSGPSNQAMDAGSYDLRILGRTTTGSEGSITIRGEGDAGNRITVKCVCEAALALALDREALAPEFGVLTPSVAFGGTLISRLEARGIRFIPSVSLGQETNRNAVYGRKLLPWGLLTR